MAMHFPPWRITESQYFLFVIRYADVPYTRMYMHLKSKQKNSDDKMRRRLCINVCVRTHNCKYEFLRACSYTTNKCWSLDTNSTTFPLDRRTGTPLCGFFSGIGIVMGIKSWQILIMHEIQSPHKPGILDSELHTWRLRTRRAPTPLPPEAYGTCPLIA